MAHEFLKGTRLRVLINGIHAKSGGGVTYLRNMLPVMADDPELELHLFLHRDQYELFGEIDERVRVHLLSYRNGFFWNLIWEQLALPVLARFMTVDVTVSPANYGPLMAPSNVIVLRNSLAVVGRETRLRKRFYWMGLAFMTGLSLVSCDRAIAVSNYARRALTFGFGKRIREKVTVINHGVRDVFRPATQEDPVVRSDGGYLLAVSDIYVQKNLHTLIPAIAKLCSRYPDIHLKIAGQPVDQGYLEELNEAIRQHGLENAIEFLGGVATPELVTLYQNCKLFVFPSTVETFGNPLVEAMSCGAPIACSNTAAMPEIVGDAARFFNPLDVEDMAEAIGELLGSDNLRRSLSINALERAKRYSWESTAQLTADVIKSVVPPDRHYSATAELRSAP